MPLSPAHRRLLVVGMGDDGWAGLAEGVRERILAADVLLGGARHLALIPARPSGTEQRRQAWPSPLRSGLPGLLDQLGDTDVVALASGDPLVSGIGSTLIDLLGPDRVEIVPAVSSVALARAAMRWPAESCETVSVVGRAVDVVRRQLAPGRRLLLLSSDETTPLAVAGLLVESGYGHSAVTVLAHLGGAAEQVFPTLSATDLVSATTPYPRLTVIAVDCVGPHRGGWTAGLPDDAFEHDGQLTKRDLRASALARLAPTPGEHLWDVGAGAGSIGIEWMRAHPTCTTTAFEGHPDRAARIARNAARLGVPGLAVVEGRAPAVLTEGTVAAPDAIFIGGGATRDGVIDACLAALRPGGRLVVHGVTLETERVLAERYLAHGGELTRLAVETTAPVGTFTGWSPARTVTQWALTV
ncbi:precorrin-6y C5,15-methyltransferase (decarboxylating) subunit CbiE [Nocardioides sp.]|uniref:precorrin-6y C5,15-methyltransferase (decarboxylating) subunit CbiE n=1 Tax=Nocardioides sp. TaxID=35761 RepID=UPI0026328468|nr:precorrin-6y C5,15-methyltransferase (decarboxylating) subunit CbiE [Nocardioides sp.]